MYQRPAIYKKTRFFLVFKGKNHPGRALLGTGRLLFLDSFVPLVVYLGMVVYFIWDFSTIS